MVQVIVQIKKWGNSLGAIIDSKTSKELGLQEGQQVKLDISRPVRASGFGILKTDKMFERDHDDHEF